MFVARAQQVKNFLKNKNKIWSCDYVNAHVMWLRHRWLVCDSAWKSFQAALRHSGPESLTVPRMKLLAINFVVKIRGGQVRESGWSCKYFFFFTGHPSLLYDWASSSKTTLCRSGLTTRSYGNTPRLLKGSPSGWRGRSPQHKEV